jgi:hypothetical protein
MGRKMFALLTCGGGTLEYDGVKYKIQVEEGKFDLEIFVLIALLVSWMLQHAKYFVCSPEVVIKLTSLCLIP